MMEAQSGLVLFMLLASGFGIEEVTETSVTSGLVSASGQDGGQNSGGLISLIVAVVLAVVTFIFCAIYWIRRRRHQKAEETELREVIVQNQDVPEVNVIPEEVVDGRDQTTTEEEAETISHWPVHVHVNTIIRHVADCKPKLKKHAPVAMTLYEKTQEIKRKRRFKSLRSFFKFQRKKSLTRSQIRKEREEKCRQVGLWLERRRGKKIKIEEKNPQKMRRSSCLCCG
ncbi:uncharacterized protein [Dendropsophus ebraccatus]|uniref:uncharacterized protein n=1 Tax=Dendropsophus ebraccatus TaxID=150705 RepID=UPI003831B2D5